MEAPSSHTTNCLVLTIGTSGGPLVMRLYFLHRCHRVWLSSFLETVGFPLKNFLFFPFSLILVLVSALYNELDWPREKGFLFFSGFAICFIFHAPLRTPLPLLSLLFIAFIPNYLLHITHSRLIYGSIPPFSTLVPIILHAKCSKLLVHLILHFIEVKNN